MIRITQHPKNPGFLLLKVPHDLNTRMGSFGPAQLAPDLGGYVMAANQYASLQAWARFHDVPVLDSRPADITRYDPNTTCGYCGYSEAECRRRWAGDHEFESVAATKARSVAGKVRTYTATVPVSDEFVAMQAEDFPEAVDEVSTAWPVAP